MKAFLIKVLPATLTKPTRLKVACPGLDSKTYSGELFDSNSQYCVQIQAIQEFVTDHKLDWNNDVIVGQLPNGDYAGIMSNSNTILYTLK